MAVCPEPNSSTPQLAGRTAGWFTWHIPGLLDKLKRLCSE